MIALDMGLLKRAMALLGEDSRYVEAIEVMNEPDNAPTAISNVQRFVEKGVDEIRKTTGKPVSLGMGKLDKAGYFIPLLKPGDIFQIHWFYNNMEMPQNLPQFSELKKNVGGLNLPEGVKVIIGEAQPNIGRQSIVPGAVGAARESGSRCGEGQRRPPSPRAARPASLRPP